MGKSAYLFIICILLIRWEAGAQNTCISLGQTPQTAFPVCGTTSFVQTTVPICGNKSIPVPGCGTSNAGYFDTNPYWYKFTCYASGTLGFLITPNDLGDDYDWQLFDITGHNPVEVFTNSSLFVSGNWAGTYGLTGASNAGTGRIQCASYPPDNVPTFSLMPYLVKGHQYLLLVSHFTQSQSGYSLSFGGGTASITDTVQPHIKAAWGSCQGNQVRIKLNKRMKCSSLASDGSDFFIQGGAANILSASGVNCGSGFDMDSLILTFDHILPVGQYKVVARKGSDGNTLLDNCGTPLPDGELASFGVYTVSASIVNYQVGLGCRVDTVSLQGSGVGPITGWLWLANGDSVSGAQQPRLLFTEFGDKLIQWVTYNDFCSDTASVNISLDNTLKPEFETQEFLCPTDKASFVNKSIGHIVSWDWTFGDGTGDNQATPLDHDYPNNPRADKQYDILLIVTDNLGCRDSASHPILKLHSCAIAVPSGFTPNGDGINDYLYPLNAFKADNLMFRVFNRFGQLVFESSDWTRKWDGTVGGKPQPPGTFVWTLQYTDRDTGQKIFKKGSSVLIR